MELLYIWIDDFRQIKKQGFSLTTKFTFTVTENQGYHDLKIKKNEAYVNLYGENIMNVTALVGKNGSGKSTILNCLKLVYGQLARLTSSLFFVYLDASTEKIHTYYYNKGGTSDMQPLKVRIDLSNQFMGGYEILKEKPYTVVRNVGEHGTVDGLDIDFSHQACAYLTNSFDHHRETVYAGIYNESTTQKLNEYLDVYIAAKERAAKNKNEEEPKIELWPTHLEDFYRRELRRDVRFVQFINDKLPNLLPHLPTSMVINFNLDDYRYMLDNDGGDQLFYDAERLADLHKRAMGEITLLESQREVFQGLLYLCTFYYALRNELFLLRKKDDFDIIMGHVGNLRNIDMSVLDSIKGLVDNLIMGEDKSTKGIKDLLGPRLLDAFAKAAPNILANEKADIYNFPFSIDHRLWNLLSIVYEFRNKSDFGFLDYSWYPPLSAGEEAILTHFARLYEIKKSIGTRPLLLLVDEVELYFHPEWQKNYVKYLIDAVKLIFKDNSVQIVLSTHSPFVVSDIPKQNLIFLKKDLAGNCTTADADFQTETFGSNIHELLTNSFFLEDGLMGKFAQSYIHDLIQEIKEVKQMTRELFVEQFKNRVAIIGEQFIKTKILELIASKSDFQLVDEILNERESELMVLRQIRAEKFNDDKNRNTGN